MKYKTASWALIAVVLALSGALFAAQGGSDAEREFAESFAAGHPLAAERAFQKLTEDRVKLPDIRFWQAAEVSRQLGKAADRRTRLAHYIKVATKFDDTVEQAAWELSRRNNDVDAYIFLLSKLGVNEMTLLEGHRLLEKFHQIRSGANFIKVAEAMLNVVRNQKEVDKIASRISSAAADRAALPTDDELNAFFSRRKFANLQPFDRVLGVRRNAFSSIQRLRLMSGSIGILSHEPFSWSVEVPEKDRKEAARISKSIASRVLNGKHGKSAYQWMRLRINVRNELFSKSQTNEMSKAFFEDFCKVADSENGYGTWEMGNLSLALARSVLQKKERNAIRERYPKFIHSEYVGSDFGLSELCKEAKSTRPYHDFLSKYHDKFGLRYHMSGDLAALGDVGEVGRNLYTQLTVGNNPNFWVLINSICLCPKSDADRAKLISGIGAKVGSHRFWKWCREDRGARSMPAMTNALVRAALAGIKDDAKPKDALLRVRAELNAMNRGEGNVAPEIVHKLFEEACDAFPGTWPNKEKSLESHIFRNLLDRYVWHCEAHGGSAVRAAKAIIMKIEPGNQEIFRSVFKNQFYNILRSNFEVMTAAAKASGNAFYIAEIYLSEGTKELPFAPEKLAAIDERALMTFIERNCCAQNPSRRRLGADATRKLLAEVFKQRNINEVNPDWYNRILCGAAELVAREDPSVAATAFPLDKSFDELLSRERPDAWRISRFMDVIIACGKRDVYLQKLYAAFDKMPSWRRLGYLVMIGEKGSLSTFPDIEWKVPDRYEPFLDRAIATLKAVPSKYATWTWIGNRDAAFGNRANEWVDRRVPSDKKSAASTKRITFLLEVDRLRQASAGGQYREDSWGRGMASYCYRAARSAIDTTNEVALAKVVNDLGWASTMHSVAAVTSLKMLEDIRKAEMWESLYIYASSLRPENEKRVCDAAARCKAEASTHLQGVYPVTEKDPLYPLYVASDEFSRNNFERATELLVKNMAAFERGADKLSPAFVAWGVDQMRVMRGEKDVFLVRARELATKLLSNESKLTPELAAAMLLVRAESFRDQQNFEGAKLEYQTIRANSSYAKTPSGRKAMFRSVDLLIESGNASSAESTLEYWLSQPDSEVQAQAHYFLARIAFERKDYEECVKQLREVFAIDYTHTEARFLHGRWKLATNSEVDETEVMVGSISDRTSVRPGQQLSITVQDRNLSVAGGGSAIPVVVRSSPGGDFEMIQLMPSARDPGLFRGVVDVKLAAPVASNGVMEVSGRDIVSYEIEPQFLSARGLEKGVSKNLVVVDDARLAIGSGAPRVDDKDAVAQVEAIVDEGMSSDTSLLSRSLRPGNPLHIAVSDRDRSTGREGEIVYATVSTTSGDIIERVPLTEVRTYSGIFRGTVRTALPPPRAYASDTAVGFNAGDVINSTRDGQWKSLADSQLVKWLAVDTMGSHLISNVVLKMQSPNDITALRLVGTLGGDTLNLGSFPAADVKSRQGLRLQIADGQRSRAENILRDYMESASAPKSVAVTNMVVKPVRHSTARLSGWFIAPSNVDFVKLGIKPLSNSENAMKGLWLVIALDGKTVMAGSGQRLAAASAPLELTVGVHRLEVFAVMSGRDDAFQIISQEVDGTTSEMPIEWFDADQHPELRDAVADLAEVVRDDEGFSAVFTKPVRLRSLRWDFLGRKSQDIVVNSVLAIDSDGKTILPVESDFSDAKGNDILEVAPGDRVSVVYADDRTSNGSRRKLEKSIVSSFTDATVGFSFEGETEPGSGRTHLYKAYRFVPGDALVLSVDDTDLDISDAADEVQVIVKTRSGRSKSVNLVEQERSAQDEGVHTGRFLGLLRTAVVGSGSEGSLECADNDELTLEYLDRENTKPGVPTTRSVSIPAIRRSKPVVTFFRAGTIREIDDSLAAASRLAAIRRRPGNDDVGNIWRDRAFAEVMENVGDSTNAIVMNIDAPILVRVSDPSRAKHSGSMLTLEAETKSSKTSSQMRIGAPFEGVELRSGAETWNAALQAGSFNGAIKLVVGTEALAEADTDVKGALAVSGTDTVTLRVRDGTDMIAERKISFASDATLDLMDSSLVADRRTVHCGESFYVRVRDSDRDVSDEADVVEVQARALGSKTTRTVRLVETMPHSGVFSGLLRPEMAAIASVTNTQEKTATSAGAPKMSDDTLAVGFGDKIEFTYTDVLPFISDTAKTLCVTGLVHEGSDGALRVFSKRFTDRDQAVLVQFRLAECLFEQAKDYRERKQNEKSSDAIARGRFILEEALKGNPGSTHAAQGEFLLANLSQELAAESRENKDEESARRLYTEALSRFSALLAADPQGTYAARSQYHKALCLEMLGDFRPAAEEYVKMTYLYPESELVGDATVRLATYYYKNEKRYEVAARVYENFQKRFPNHSKASRALFMSGSCFVKEADSIQEKIEEKGTYRLDPKAAKLYQRAVGTFEKMFETYRSERPEMRAQALYWAGDTSLKCRDFKSAYLFLKRTILEYPETEWARRARGLLVRESERFDGME